VKSDIFVGSPGDEFRFFDFAKRYVTLVPLKRFTDLGLRNASFRVVRRERIGSNAALFS
jgi:hypothetical protein